MASQLDMEESLHKVWILTMHFSIITHNVLEYLTYSGTNWFFYLVNFDFFLKFRQIHSTLTCKTSYIFRHIDLVQFFLMVLDVLASSRSSYLWIRRSGYGRLLEYDSTIQTLAGTSEKSKTMEQWKSESRNRKNDR